MNHRLPPSKCALALLLFTLTLLFCHILGCFSSPPPQTEAPLIDGHPFIAVWHAPTARCRELHVPLDTSAFHAVTTPAAVPRQFLTIFYEDRLGLYPRVGGGTLAQKQFNGGIPQRGNLTRHLDTALRDIAHYVDSLPGLAVIDWEAWRPLWDHNWGSKRIYHKLSVAYAQKKQASSPSNPEEITADAKSQFETAGKSFMESTIALGIEQRPKKRWGFYLFPDCYNHGWREPGYTGRCSEKTQQNNDALRWLWEASTALYPSVYLHSSLRNSPRATLYVQNRVQEALRVARLPKRPHTAPVYVYSRPLYRDQNKYLSMEDLVNTIGESAALGASGTILWGASADFNDTASCEALSGYLATTLNRYVANVTAAARLCSHALCQSNGRCVRKDHESRDYLHLNRDHFDITKAEEGTYLAVGAPSSADLRALAQRFTCQCYAGRRCSAKLSSATEDVMFIHV